MKELKRASHVTELIVKSLGFERSRRWVNSGRTKFAEAIGFSESHVSNLATGRRPLNPDQVLERRKELSGFFLRRVSPWHDRIMAGLRELDDNNQNRESSETTDTEEVTDTDKILSAAGIKKEAEEHDKDGAVLNMEAVVSILTMLKALCPVNRGLYDVTMFCSVDNRRSMNLDKNCVFPVWLNNKESKEDIKEIIKQATPKGVPDYVPSYHGDVPTFVGIFEWDHELSRWLCDGDVFMAYATWVSRPLKIKVNKIVNDIQEGKISRDDIQDIIESTARKTAELTWTKASMEYGKQLAVKDEVIEELVESRDLMKKKVDAARTGGFLHAVGTSPLGYYYRKHLVKGFIQAVLINKGLKVSDTLAQNIVAVMTDDARWLTSRQLTPGNHSTPVALPVSSEYRGPEVEVYGARKGASLLYVIGLETCHYNVEATRGTKYEVLYSVYSFGFMMNHMKNAIRWQSPKTFTAPSYVAWVRHVTSGTIAEPKLIKYLCDLGENEEAMAAFLTSWDAWCKDIYATRGKVVTVNNSYGEPELRLNQDQSDEKTKKKANYRPGKKLDS